MSLVTATEQARVLALLGSGPASRDELLLSLARQRVWTTKQRAMVERIWNEERAKRKEAGMKTTSTTTTTLMLAALILAGLSGCAATYEKRFLDHEGRAVVLRETHEPDWWNTLGTPDWMNVRRETITRDGRVVVDRTCRHEPTRPLLLDCTPVAR